MTRRLNPKMGGRVTDIDDSIVACRAWRHKWPELVPGKPLPRKFHPRLQPGGVVEITEYCARCGKKRVSWTLSGGVFDRGTIRRYTDPVNWVVVPDSTPRDFQAETYRRLNDEIMAAAKRSADVVE